MNEPDDELPHVRALTVHDAKRGTARLRTEIELPTLEEFAEMCDAENDSAADDPAPDGLRRE